MKQCPTCKGIFADDTLRYCLSDGSLLTSPYDSEATHIFSPPLPPVRPPVVGPSDRPALVQPTRQGVSPIVVYVLVAMLALLVGGGVVAFALLRPGTPSPMSSLPPTATTKQESATVANNDVPAPITTPTRDPNLVSTARTPAETPRPSPKPQPTVVNDSESALAHKPCFELKIMRNEIYASHGYIFQTSEAMREYFSRQSWYRPRYTDVRPFLSAAEKRRAQQILQIENRKGCPQ